jgi:cytochrome c-type biogenesis protein CcmF
MAELGTTTVILVLLLASWAGALGLVGARRRSAAMVDAARLATAAVALCASLAVVLLAYGFAVSDFSISYVQRYSERAMPLFYKLAAVWGGQEGSLLFWTWLLAVASAWSIQANRVRLRELVPWAIVVLMAVVVFFCLLLLLAANPFDSFLSGAVLEGKGLNPLLQNAYMVTHPPALYLGYVGMTIPFAFAIAALVTGRTDESWIQATRPWALGSWYFLAVGLVLGMLWAYEELGWGGYWGWDPVENAGLIPWLTSTAYIHSVIVQERRGMLKVWNVVLAILTFELTIFGTFLTRSGFIQSVHAFAQSSIGYYFLAFMGLVLVLGIALIVWRAPLLKSRGTLESVASREFSFVLNNWILLSAALLVMVLTIFPTLSQIFGHKVTISAPAFNKWMVPLGLALLVLKGIGPMIGWRRSTLGGLRHQFLIPTLVTLATLGGLAALGLREPLALATFAGCAFVLATIVLEVARGVQVRRRSTGGDPLTALGGLFSRNRRRYGGYLVHAGVALMFIGFGGEAYKLESEIQLARGERTVLGRYTIRYDGIEHSRDEQKEMSTATLSVYRGGDRLGSVHPARWLYFKHEGQPTSEVDIRRGLREDLFVVLGSFDPGSDAATFKMIVNPLVNWIWIGFVLLSLGTGVALLPRRVRGVLGAVRVSSLIGLGVAAALTLSSAAVLAGPAPRGHSPEEKTAPVKIASEAERRLFSKLACMCPTCPRIPLSVCQCGFAGNEREAIRAKLGLGWSEERVLRWYLEERGAELSRPRFGAEALTTPPDDAINRLSWLLPYGVSLVAIVLLFLVGRRWVRAGTRPAAAAPGATTDAAAPTDREQTLSAGERSEYEQLLDRELRKMD